MFVFFLFLLFFQIKYYYFKFVQKQQNFFFSFLNRSFCHGQNHGVPHLPSLVSFFIHLFFLLSLLRFVLFTFFSPSCTTLIIFFFSSPSSFNHVCHAKFVVVFFYFRDFGSSSFSRIGCHLYLVGVPLIFIHWLTISTLYV